MGRASGGKRSLFSISLPSTLLLPPATISYPSPCCILSLSSPINSNFLLLQIHRHKAHTCALAAPVSHGLVFLLPSYPWLFLWSNSNLTQCLVLLLHFPRIFLKQTSCNPQPILPWTSEPHWEMISDTKGNERLYYCFWLHLWPIPPIDDIW